MAVRAKMRCNSVTLARSNVAKKDENGLPVRDEAGNYVYETFDQPTVQLGAVTGTGADSDENKAFWNATPQGSVNMTITNPDAAEFFELGEEYYVDFEKAT